MALCACVLRLLRIPCLSYSTTTQLSLRIPSPASPTGPLRNSSSCWGGTSKEARRILSSLRNLRSWGSPWMLARSLTAGGRWLTTPRRGSRGSSTRSWLSCGAVPCPRRRRSSLRATGVRCISAACEDGAKAVVSQAPKSIFFEPNGQVVVCCSDRLRASDRGGGVAGGPGGQEVLARALGEVSRSPSGLLRRQPGRPLRAHEGTARIGCVPACCLLAGGAMRIAWQPAGTNVSRPGATVRTATAGFGLKPLRS